MTWFKRAELFADVLLMIPFIEVYTWRVGPFAVRPFGPLVALAVYVGWKLAKRRALKLGVNLEVFTSFTWWMIIGGFAGGHVLDEIFYHPREIVNAPWTLLFFWEGLSSYGGFIGVFIGGMLWRFVELVPFYKVGSLFTIERPRIRAKPSPVLLFSDIYSATFPFAWAIGRLGCTVVHDHPGALAGPHALFAVAYGPGPVDDYGILGLHHGVVPRYDLGLLEMLFTIVIAIGFAVTWKKKFLVGTYDLGLLLIYPPVRFCMDFLRLDDDDGGDVRYGNLTPAQWACIAFFVLGLALIPYVRGRGERAQPVPAIEHPKA